jgi:cell division protein FtsQ
MKVKKIKRRKFNFKKFFKFLLFLCITISLTYYITKIPIKNIIINGSSYLSDEEIIETAKLENYPSFIKTLKTITKKRIKKIPLVKDVEIKKRFGFKFEINITEYIILFQIRSTGEYVLNSKEKTLEIETNKNIPILINYVPDEILTKMIEKFTKLEENVIIKISEIEYTPTTFDSERFLFYMNDGNEVYITLNKIKEFNNYTKIKEQLGTKRGILYLDSGNYFEVKE